MIKTQAVKPNGTIVYWNMFKIPEAIVIEISVIPMINFFIIFLVEM